MTLTQLAGVVGCLGLVVCGSTGHSAEVRNPVRPIAQGAFPRRVHVFEDFETEIEKRWWLRGRIVTGDLPKSVSAVPNRRACKAVETLNFDRKMGDRVNKVKGVVFNPVPGPPMGKSTRLSFRYRLNGSDTIKVQIYSLSKGYHRFVSLSGLPQNKWQTATVDMTQARRPDGGGGPLAEDERIDDIQFYVAREADLWIDDIVLFDAGEDGQRQPFPRRWVFTGWFDTGKQGKEWPGDFEIVPHRKPRTWDAAKSVINKTTGKHWLRVGLRGRRQLSPRTSVEFDYRLAEDSPLRVVLTDTEGDIRNTRYVGGSNAGGWFHARVDFVSAPDAEQFVHEIRFDTDAGRELQIDNILIYEPGNPRGAAQVEQTRPKRFPHRIWAACDFEARTPDYAWFGKAQTNDIPSYPGNKAAMAAAAKPYGKFAALMTGINPVPGPRMGKVNSLYVRYKLSNATQATFQHFSLSTNDNNHIRLSGLTMDKWAEATMNFSRDARRNDGTPGVPFKDGERMDDLKVFVGKAKDGREYDLVLDDVIFFSNDPTRPPEPEPFPNRVIFLAAFDTGTNPKVLRKYWPGEFELMTRNTPPNSFWGVARAVPRKDGKGKWLRLQLQPLRRVGKHTKLRFRYHLRGASRMTVQIFDATDQDNRHLHLSDCRQNAWTTQYLDFTRDAQRNDGRKTPFAAGHLVDDIFFFVQPNGQRPVELLIDEVVLYDAGSP